MQISKAFYEPQKLLPKLVHVAGGARQHLALIHFTGRRFPQMLNLHLQPIVKARDGAANFNDVSPFKILRDTRITRIPYPRLNLPCLIPQDQVQIRLVGPGSSLLLVQHQEKRIEDPALLEGREIGNIDVLHSAGSIQQSAERIKKSAHLRENPDA